MRSRHRTKRWMGLSVAGALLCMLLMGWCVHNLMWSDFVAGQSRRLYPLKKALETGSLQVTLSRPLQVRALP